LDAAIEQRAHGPVAGVVDQHVEAADFSLQAFGQLTQGQAIVDVQLYGAKAGGAQGGQVFGFARSGPDLITGLLEYLGQGATNAAGTSGDQCDGLDHAGILVLLWDLNISD
jgi:hypothetical protein